MSPASFFQLIVLAAIWGASFLFMRLAVPTVGAATLTELRVLSAAVFLFAIAWMIRKNLAWKQHWKHYLILGFFNSALPFVLFSFAAHSLSASLLAVLNATAPIWGVILTAAWDKQAIQLKTILGIILGISGVGLLVGLDQSVLESGSWLAILAAISAAFSYGIASTYTRHAINDSFNNAHGSMWTASLILLPLVFIAPPTEAITTEISIAILALGIMCTGIAYLLYFKLIKDLGAPSALTVTFIIPVFGILWGHLFLDEVVGWHTIAGSIIVVLGTALVTNFSFKALLKR